ncbi:MAG TPA: hypothetical protein VFQ53_15905 [Kofleriaceae bacterium]|nr:hypothetical protein [Kofleriaceae bacterium]
MTELATLAGLAISPVRTERFTLVRHVDEAALDPAIVDRFERPSAAAPHLVAVYVDPHELSFSTFENIVPVDRLLPPLELALHDPTQLADGVLRLRLAGSTAALAQLDALGVYVAPLNAASRGGRRMIVHSAQLAGALTDAVRAALPAELLAGFVHVNPVFRCNRFEPGDAPFRLHLDTPYYDRARNHISRHTLLIYMTGGSGTPALQIGELAVEHIEPWTCLVLDQRLAHEGQPFVDGAKVFLRTELIYEDAALAHDPAIGALFAKATYLTGEAVRHPELAHRADEAYDRAAAAHWHGIVASWEREPILHKQFRGVHFFANGYDYWFPRHAHSLEECAALALLDVLNASVGGAAFRAQCTSEPIERPVDREALERELAAYDVARTEPVFAAVDKASLFPAPEPDACCCHLHSRERFDATRSLDILEFFERAQVYCRRRIDPAPILIFGDEVMLDPSRFVIERDRIHVLSQSRLAPVHFAACRWDHEPTRYVDVDYAIGALQPLVPPILFERTPHAHHLMLDFFRNTWTVGHRSYGVPIPYIRTEPVGEGLLPWVRAAVQLMDVDELYPRPSYLPWWARGSMLFYELFAPPYQARSL